MMESETDKSFSQRTLQQSAQKHLTNNDTAIIQREREINDIAKGIIELADIFKELSSMVIDQGTMLDRIDYNVERMAVDVKEADKELTVVCCPQKGAISELISVLRPLGINERTRNAKFFSYYFFLLSECSSSSWSNLRGLNLSLYLPPQLLPPLFRRETWSFGKWSMAISCAQAP